MITASDDAVIRVAARRALVGGDTAIPNGLVGDASYLLLPTGVLAALLVGALAYATVGDIVANALWTFSLIITGAPVVWRTISAARQGHFATDIVASLSIVGAIALAQPFAGLVIVLMQTGGEALEGRAEGRASSALHALEAAAPRMAHRADGANRVIDVPLSEIAVGDLLLIRPGDLVPCDGLVTSGTSDVDTSRLTGEYVPIEATPGTTLLSGSLNGAGVLHLRTAARAADSQYARIVGLVRSAQASKAPIQRLADRYAVWFTPIAILACAATMLITHDWLRVLAVLVVATPCPLILAPPVAIVGGINRAARRHIIVRTGGALEGLSRVTAAVFDKTGTITIGHPRVDHVTACGQFDEQCVLRWAGAAEHGSSHMLARVTTAAAERRLGTLPVATSYRESAGQGIEADVEGHHVIVGSSAYVLARCAPDDPCLGDSDPADPSLRAFVAIDGRLAGTITYADEVRADAPAMLAELARQGVKRTALISGDSVVNARDVAARVGIQESQGGMLPGAKTDAVRRITSEGYVVMMIGDGVNDAPALKTADVGVAMARHGGGITTEAADVILLTESLDRVNEALRIGRRTMRIARQSILAGLGLSAAAMAFAGLGAITPAAGAVLQEVIDIAVIVNALRASRA